MASNLFDHKSCFKSSKTLQIQNYSHSLRRAALQIAISVPEIEARVHALNYFLAEEKEYCERCGLESSAITELGINYMLDTMLRLKIINNVKWMSKTYLKYESNHIFEQMLAEIMLHLYVKPSSELILLYEALKVQFQTLIIDIKPITNTV